MGFFDWFRRKPEIEAYRPPASTAWRTIEPPGSKPAPAPAPKAAPSIAPARVPYGPGHPDFEQKFRGPHEPTHADHDASKIINTKPERPPTLEHYLNRFPPGDAHIAKEMYAADRATVAARTLQSYENDPNVPPGKAKEHYDLTRAGWGLPPAYQPPRAAAPKAPPSQQKQHEPGD